MMMVSAVPAQKRGCLPSRSLRRPMKGPLTWLQSPVTR